MGAEQGRRQSSFAQEGELSFRLLRDRDEDYRLMTRWLNDDRVLEWFGGRDRPRSFASIREKYRERIRNAGPAVPTLLLREGQPIGFLQFYEAAALPEGEPKRLGLEDGRGVFGIDLFIGEPGLWSQGLGTRMVSAFTRWLFRERGATRVFADPRVANERAVRCFERSGMRKVRVLPGHELYEGREEDCWLLVIERLPA